MLSPTSVSSSWSGSKGSRHSTHLTPSSDGLSMLFVLWAAAPVVYFEAVVAKAHSVVERD
jgi:hypothetical protein